MVDTIFRMIIGFSLYEGMLFGLVALGIYLTLRVLAFPDLTVEGSYTLGGATAAMIIVNGYSPMLAMFVAFAAGLLAGFITGILNTRIRLPALLAGIVMMVGLYSVNLRIMGGANVSLLRYKTIFDHVGTLLGLTATNVYLLIFVAAIITLIVFLILYWFLRTEFGLALRATGDNELMVRALGSDTNKNIIIGVGISNGLVALTGSIVAQYQGFADVGMGIGLIVMGLASVIIGEALVHPRRVGGLLAAALTGAFVYRLIITVALRVGLHPGDLKLITAAMVVIALAVPFVKKKIKGEWIPPAERW